MSSFSASWLKESWKRWLAWLVLASLFAVACVFLSQWQFSRRAEAVARIELVQNNFDQALAPIGSLTSPFEAKNEWRPVELEGRFLVSDAFLVRNRPFNGAAGFLQFIPFETKDGTLVAVETGWLPSGNEQDEPDLVPLPTEETVKIWGRIRPTEPKSTKDAPTGQLASVNSSMLFEKAGLSGQTLDSVYIRLGESYRPGEVLPKVLGKPDLNEGNHLSYAMQWILFALMAFGALWWAVRQELRIRRMAADPNYRPKTRKKIGDDDKNAEDGFLTLIG